jgi:two-component system NtrC family sensor kinase
MIWYGHCFINPKNVDLLIHRHESLFHMNQKKFSEIKNYVLASMILVPVIPFILILSIGFYHFKTSIQTSTIANMKRIVEDHRQLIESFLDERRADLEFVCDAYTFKELSNPKTLRDIFDHLQKGSNAFVDIGIFNKAGVHLAYYGPYSLEGKIYKEADWFQKVLDQGYYVSDVFLGYRNIPHFIVAVARKNMDDAWIVRATIDSQTFCTLVGQVRIGKTGEAYIINHEGVLQTQRRSGGELMQKSIEEIDFSSAQTRTDSFLRKNKDGKQHLYTTTKLKDKQWLLIVRQEENDAFMALRSTIFMTAIIWVAGGLIIIVVAFYLTHQIVWRLEKIDQEKEQLNQQLIGASRLAELGEMAAGFAHEINNPLQIIKNERSLIEMTWLELKEKGFLTDSEAVREIEDSMSQINIQISRCAKITQAILKFGRQGEPSLQDIALKEFILDVTAMVEKKASVAGISLIKNLADMEGFVHGDPAQLQQVFLNLFNNAIDAIIDKYGNSGGELTVKTRPGHNGAVEIIVRDNGCGISPENMKKIFSPFFTTKPVGQGTGLGLAVCYGIINNMNGTMEVDSTSGKGTLFTIRLPVTTDSKLSDF